MERIFIGLSMLGLYLTIGSIGTTAIGLVSLLGFKGFLLTSPFSQALFAFSLTIGLLFSYCPFTVVGHQKKKGRSIVGETSKDISK